MRTMPRKLWYLLVILFLSMLAMTMASVQYSSYVDRKSSQKWCDVVVTLDDFYQSNKTIKNSPNPSVRKLAVDIHNLRRDLGC